MGLYDLNPSLKAMLLTCGRAKASMCGVRKMAAYANISFVIRGKPYPFHQLQTFGADVYLLIPHLFSLNAFSVVTLQKIIYRAAKLFTHIP